MKQQSKKTLRYASFFALFILVGLSFSCKKEKNEPTPTPSPSNPSGPSIDSTIGSAHLNFVTDGETIDFKSYKDPNSLGATMIMQEKTLQLRLVSSSPNGSFDNGPTLFVTIEKESGFQTGDVFSVLEDQSNYKISATVNKSDTDTELYYASNHYGNHPDAVGEFKIISLTNDKIKGEFSFKSFTINSPNKEVEIANGKFETAVQRF